MYISAIPKSRNLADKEFFYTGFNRFGVEPDEMHKVLKNVLEAVPDKIPTNETHARVLKMVLNYEKGFTARHEHHMKPGENVYANKDIERFSHLLGARNKPAIALHDRLIGSSVNYDGEGENFVNS